MMFFRNLYYDIITFVRSPLHALSVLTFFLAACVLFPFATGTGNILIQVAGAGVWVIALMTTTLSTRYIFKEDWEDGTLEMWVSFCPSLSMRVLARICATCIVYGLPLCFIGPITASALGLQAHYLVPLLLSLACTLPGIFAVNIFSSAVTLTARGGAILAAVISLPLTVPSLIFGSGVIRLAAQGTSILPILGVSSGLSIFFLTLCPVGISICIRHAVSQ